MVSMPLGFNTLNLKMFSSKLKKTITELPMASPIKAAEILCEQLDKILMLDANPQQILQVLESVIEPVNQINASLKKQLLDVSPLIAIQKKDTITATLKLSLKYATAYASLLNKKDRLPVEQNTFKAKAIFYSMFYLLEALIINYEVYMAVTEKLWFRLHTLYVLAEQENLLEEHIQNKTYFNTIDQIYKTAILISTASPYQLRRRDIERLYTIVVKWAGEVDIIQAIDEATYVISLNQDKPPIFKALFAGETATFVRGISTKKFLDAINHIIKQHSNEVLLQDTALSKNVFEYVERSWGGAYHRDNERTEKIGNIDIAFGLSTTHYFISGKNAYDFYSSIVASFPEVENISEDLPDSKNEFTPFEVKQNKQDAWDTHKILHNKHDGNQTQKYKLFNFEYENESTGGICIKINSKNMPILHTGELIGMHHINGEYQWAIGIIRWLKQENDGTLKIGVQNLAPTALTIAVKISIPDSEDLSRALLLPEIHDAKKPSTIILPAKHYPPGTELTVYYDKNHVQIVLIEPIIANDHFYQYSYQTHETALQKPQVEFNKKVEKETLDNVWDDLIQ